MKNEIICELTRDLLPNYLEGLTSTGSNEAIENHLAQCADCQALCEEMKQGLTALPPQIIEDTSEEKNIKPFLKLKKRIRRIIAITILCCVIVFGGGAYYFAHGFYPDINDITITCEKFDGMVDITFTAKSKNIILNSYVGGYHESAGDGEIDYVELEAFHKNPFKKAIRNQAYFGYTFIDKDTILNSSAQKVHITDDSYFCLQLKDQAVKINIADLYQGKITIME